MDTKKGSSSSSKSNKTYRKVSKQLRNRRDGQGHWVIRRNNGYKWYIRSSNGVVVELDRNEELKAMNAYKRDVTKSPEAAKAFLIRIGAFDIK